MNIIHLKTPLNKYTFKSKTIKSWVENHCKGKTVLNLFAGQTILSDCAMEIRNDIDTTMNADYHLDALEFVTTLTGYQFDVIILDPPYAYRKSMEMYNGHKNSRFNEVKNNLSSILKPNGKVITFGYQSISMGMTRGFTVKEILIMSHGGAIHDTIATLEQWTHETPQPGVSCSPSNRLRTISAKHYANMGA